MKLSQMRYFSASCHAGNISKAAEELHISQPSVTAAIKALEDELGVSLLHRGNRAVSPTPDGERFLHRCDQILADVDSLEAEFAELSKKHRTINVGIPPMIGSILFPEIFDKAVYAADVAYQKYVLEHCGVRVTGTYLVTLNNQYVFDGTLDLAVVTMGEDVPTRLDALRLTSYDMMYCVGKKHPLAKRKTVSLKETADYPMILFSGGYYQNRLLESRFRLLEIQPDVLFHSNQLTTIKSFIRENLASGFIMAQVIQKEDAIITIPVEEGLTLNVAVVWRKDDYLTKEAKTFINFCRRTFDAS